MMVYLHEDYKAIRGIITSYSDPHMNHPYATNETMKPHKALIQKNGPIEPS